MPQEFKTDYKSFEARLEVFCKPTHWEEAHGVNIVEKKVISLSDEQRSLKNCGELFCR